VSLRLRCTVRGCGKPLTREGSTLACAAGHAFDRAREGYWNLLQPQDRRSGRAGDRGEAVAARRRWLQRGFVDELIATLRETAAALPPGDAIDLGCGEGTVTGRVLAGRAGEICGVDLSVPAVRMAARLLPDATWIVANADRGLPFEDGSVSLAMSVFGRRPAAEIARVLGEGAFLLLVVPGPDDLIELREAAQGRGEHRERTPDALAELAPYAELIAGTRWSGRARHDREALADALAMSYRGGRIARHERLAGVEELDVTLSAEILVLRRSP
jgi:23S rRNA (guanine745-N1)-methyltransferase